MLTDCEALADRMLDEATEEADAEELARAEDKLDPMALELREESEEVPKDEPAVDEDRPLLLAADEGKDERLGEAVTDDEVPTKKNVLVVGRYVLLPSPDEDETTRVFEVDALRDALTDWLLEKLPDELNSKLLDD